MRTSRLRTYAPMRRQSVKVKKAAPDFQAVYRLVDQRSEGRCEVEETILDNPRPNALFRRFYVRCPKRATQHHHLLRPRRSHHEPGLVIHVCGDHHDRMDWPYKRGRLVWLHGFTFAIRYASDKFAARQPKAAP